MILTPLKEKPKKICDFLTYKEATRSITAERHGIDNTPYEENLERMVITGEMTFLPLRRFIGVPLFIHSMFRCLALNLVISKYGFTSQHLALPIDFIINGIKNDGGSAIDIDAQIYGGTTNKYLFFTIIDYEIPFDKLIWEKGTDQEPGWIHVSNRYPKNRHIVKRIMQDGRESILNTRQIDMLR
jgi:hypothetical protein